MKTSICAIARNEKDYLSEWIVYHLNLGFNHIFLYDNNDLENESTTQLCAGQAWKEQVTIIDYRGKTAAQLSAYNECYESNRNNFDWIAFIDIDEFITFGAECTQKTINQYLECVNNFDVIVINWMYYGDNEEIYQRKEGVISRFPKTLPNLEVNKYVKSIVKTSANIKFVRNPHCVDGQVRICDDCQQKAPYNEPFKEPSFRKLYIRHYGTKTIDEFIRNKILRGAADQNSNPYNLNLFYTVNRRSKAKREVEKQYFHISRKKDKTPLVSVIIPNYNHKNYLKQRIDSILTQTFTDFEIIILDDCSSDNSQKLLLSYQNNPYVSHIMLNTQNSGSPFIQWEKGIRLAKGKYIWIAESDDCAQPDFLQLTVPQLEKHPEARLCLTGSYIIDENNNPVQTDEFDKWEEDEKAYLFESSNYLKSHMFKTNSAYNASMVLFKREGCLTDILGHYRKMRYCGDWLFWIEQIRKGSVIEIHKKLNYFRKCKENTTNKGTANGNSLEEITFIKNYFYTKLLTSKDRKEILIDKYNFYKHVRRFPVSSKKRKRELFRMISKEAGITFFTYLAGKWLAH